MQSRFKVRDCTTCCPIMSEGRSVYSCITVFGIIYIKLLINTQYMRFVLFTEYLKLLFQQLLLLLRELLLITARLLLTCSFLPSSVNDSAAFSSLFIAKNPPFIYLFISPRSLPLSNPFIPFRQTASQKAGGFFIYFCVEIIP